MLRSDPVQPGRISKHALRSMQRILAQPLSLFRPTRLMAAVATVGRAEKRSAFRH